MIPIKLKIHTWPAAVLRKKCKPVTVVDDNIRSLLDQMYLIMMTNDGVGLAANQVGLDIQLVIIEFKNKLFKLINPKIIKKDGNFNILEGCLSFPGLELEIKRAKQVWISALNELGEEITIEADDILAVIFQHEIDHINGICFIDRAPFWQKLKYKLKGIKNIKPVDKKGIKTKESDRL